MRSRQEIEADAGLSGPVREPILEVLLDNRELMNQLLQELAEHDRVMNDLARELLAKRAPPRTP